VIRNRNPQLTKHLGFSLLLQEGNKNSQFASNFNSFALGFLSPEPCLRREKNQHYSK
jgi:hypothetical protein